VYYPPTPSFPPTAPLCGRQCLSSSCKNYYAKLCKRKTLPRTARLLNAGKKEATGMKSNHLHFHINLLTLSCPEGLSTMALPSTNIWNTCTHIWKDLIVRGTRRIVCIQQMQSFFVELQPPTFELHWLMGRSRILWLIQENWLQHLHLLFISFSLHRRVNKDFRFYWLQPRGRQLNFKSYFQ